MTDNELSLSLRADFDVIASWVKNNDKVLDLGCGDGSLIAWLHKHKKNIKAWGIEIDENQMLKAIRNGVNVIQTDLEDGLKDFADNSFDHVILSKTLQTVFNTEDILKEMIRVGKSVVVSFPNFAFWKNLESVIIGHMPVSEDLPYEWYNSPNVRFLTLLDFEGLCRKLNLQILDRHLLDENGDLIKDNEQQNKKYVYPLEDLNFLTSFAVYRLGPA